MKFPPYFQTLYKKNMNKFKTKHSDYTDAQFKETLLGFATLIIGFTAFMGFLFYYLG